MVSLTLMIEQLVKQNQELEARVNIQNEYFMISYVSELQRNQIELMRQLEQITEYEQGILDDPIKVELKKQLSRSKCQLGDILNAAMDYGGTELVDRITSAIGLSE